MVAQLWRGQVGPQTYMGRRAGWAQQWRFVFAFGGRKLDDERMRGPDRQVADMSASRTGGRQTHRGGAAMRAVGGYMEIQAVAKSCVRGGR